MTNPLKLTTIHIQPAPNSSPTQHTAPKISVEDKKVASAAAGFATTPLATGTKPITASQQKTIEPTPSLSDKIKNFVKNLFPPRKDEKTAPNEDEIIRKLLIMPNFQVASLLMETVKGRKALDEHCEKRQTKENFSFLQDFKTLTNLKLGSPEHSAQMRTIMDKYLKQDAVDKLNISDSLFKMINSDPSFENLRIVHDEISKLLTEAFTTSPDDIIKLNKAITPTQNNNWTK